jgi:hypothetical protein
MSSYYKFLLYFSTPISNISLYLAVLQLYFSRFIRDVFGGGDNIVIKVRTNPLTLTHSFTHAHTDALYGAESFKRS